MANITNWNSIFPSQRMFSMANWNNLMDNICWSTALYTSAIKKPDDKISILVQVNTLFRF